MLKSQGQNGICTSIIPFLAYEDRPGWIFDPPWLPIYTPEPIQGKFGAYFGEFEMFNRMFDFGNLRFLWITYAFGIFTITLRLRRLGIVLMLTGCLPVTNLMISPGLKVTKFWAFSDLINYNLSSYYFMISVYRRRLGNGREKNRNTGRMSNHPRPMYRRKVLEEAQ